MPNIGARLKAIREKRGWTITKVATLAEVSQPYLSRLERGGVGYTEESLRKLAGALGVSLELLFSSSRSNVEDAVPDFRAVPVLDYVQAGQWTAIQSSLQDGEIRETVSTNLDCPPSTFALRIKGDSMEPRFKAGDLVLVDPTISPKPGDFVVATDETGEATFKQFRNLGKNEQGREAFELIPLNTLYHSIRSDRQPIAIVGVMIEHRTYRHR